MPTEDAPDAAARVVILSHGFWVREFDASSEVIGTTIALDGEAHTVVGVLSPDVEVGEMSLIDVYTPLAIDLAKARRDERTLMVSGRLKPDVTLEQATAEIQTIARRLQDAHPVTNAGWDARAASFWEGTTGRNTGLMLTLLTLVVTFVLLIACANVANLMLARVVTRQKEMALRVALGAGRGRLVRQLLTESLILGLLGGGAGLVVAMIGLDVIRAVSYEQIFQQIVIDHRVLLFTAALALITPFICTLAPALQSSRVDLNGTLKEGSARVGGGRRGRRVRSILVVSQVALAVTMLVVAGLATRTALALHRIDLGFDTRNVLTLQIDLPDREYPADGQARAFYEGVVARIHELPGVEVAAAVSRLPVFGGETTTLVTIQGQPAPTPDDQPWALAATTSPAYPQVLKIPLVTGRVFSRADRPDTRPVVLINLEMARRYWPGKVEPLGQRIKLGGPDAQDPWREVVGIVGNVQGSDPLTPPPPRLYVPLAQQAEHAMAVVIRTTGDPTGESSPFLVETLHGS